MIPPGDHRLLTMSRDMCRGCIDNAGTHKRSEKGCTL